MKRQPWCSFLLANVSLTDFGWQIPSPFVSLELTNGEIQSCTSWTLNCVVGGDDTRKVNIAAFETLLYGAAQAANEYGNSSGIPVSFAIGWLDEKGNVSEYLSYQGFTLQFKVTTSGQYMRYAITGFATLAMQSVAPVLRIPEVSGIVQGSALFEGLARAVRATDYYELDVDHNDAPTYIRHGPLNRSFNSYVRGSLSGQDDFDNFPGCIALSKSFNATRDSAGVAYPIKSIHQLMTNVPKESIGKYLKKSITDSTPQCASYSFWVDEPDMTHPGIMHYKSNASLADAYFGDVLEYGTAHTNILSLNGSYSGVAYNMTDMRFGSVGFAVDVSGNTIIQDNEVVNSWSSSLADVYQTVNIINNVNAIASQFSGDFSVQIAGSVKKYEIAQPVSLLVMAGNTVSPVTGIYNVISVSHTISTTFVTTLKIQRLVQSTANMVSSNMGITVANSTGYPSNTIHTTSNIKTPYYVDFGQLYPDFTYMANWSA